MRLPRLYPRNNAQEPNEGPWDELRGGVADAFGSSRSAVRGDAGELFLWPARLSRASDRGNRPLQGRRLRTQMMMAEAFVATFKTSSSTGALSATGGFRLRRFATVC